jgi:hypothetical protein
MPGWTDSTAPTHRSRPRVYSQRLTKGRDVTFAQVRVTPVVVGGHPAPITAGDVSSGAARRATRARDADRSATCAALDSALVDGQLDTVEHRERVAAAMTATTLAELAVLTADLQGAPPPPAPRPRRRSRTGVWFVGLAGVLVVALVVTMCSVGRSVDPVAGPPGAAAADGAPTQGPLFTAAGWDAMLSWLRTEHRGTTVVGATVYPTYARIEVLEPDDPRHTRRVDYPPRKFDASMGGNRKLDDPLVDLATVDQAALRRLLAEAPERVGVTDPTSTYMVFGFPTRPADQLGIYVSNEHRQSGMIIVTVRGEIVSVSPVNG